MICSPFLNINVKLGAYAWAQVYLQAGGGKWGGGGNIPDAGEGDGGKEGKTKVLVPLPLGQILLKGTSTVDTVQPQKFHPSCRSKALPRPPPPLPHQCALKVMRYSGYACAS